MHHGDCLGADNDAASLASQCGIYEIVSHPPTVQTLRANNPHAKYTHQRKPYLVRNRDIVDATEILIVCPKEMQPAKSGGTWYTYFYALGKGRHVIVLWPDGGKTEINRPLATPAAGRDGKA